MKIIFSIIFTLFLMTSSYSQETNTISVRDFKPLIGKWTGSLTYLDYTSGKPYSMPADLTIFKIEESNKFVFSNIYPYETNANSIDTLYISPDGKFLGTENVRLKKIIKNGDIEIITEEIGKDGNDQKPAVFKHVYTIGKNVFKKKKEVLFQGDTNWIMRHEYIYKPISSLNHQFEKKSKKH